MWTSCAKTGKFRNKFANNSGRKIKKNNYNNITIINKIIYNKILKCTNKNFVVNFGIFLWCYSPSLLIFLVSRSQTHTYNRQESSVRVTSSSHSVYLHYTQQTQEKNIHTLSRIRTLDLSNQAAVDLDLTPGSDR